MYCGPRIQPREEEGLKILAKVRETTGLPVVTEVLDFNTFDLVENYTDIIQIGTRNMQNFSLLRRAGKASKPVLLKRGMAATIDEWLMAADGLIVEIHPLPDKALSDGAQSLYPEQFLELCEQVRAIYNIFRKA